MRKIPPKKYAISLYEALAGADSSAVTELIKSFIQLLARNRDLTKSDKIVKAFEKYLYDKEQIQPVEVQTATVLNNETKEAIVNRLKESLNRTVLIKEKIVPDLIGGIIVKFDDTVIDGSVKSRINLLANSLK